MLPSTIQKVFVSTDVTFNENESYFPAPYLQGENSIKEDKDQDSYLINPFLIDLPLICGPVSDLVSVPHFFELESWLLEPTPENRMTEKMY